MDEGDGQLVRHRIDRSAPHADLPAIRAMHASQDLDQGGLTRAVAAQQGMHLTRPDIKIDLIDGARAPEDLDDILHGYDRRHVPSPRRPCRRYY